MPDIDYSALAAQARKETEGTSQSKTIQPTMARTIAGQTVLDENGNEVKPEPSLIDKLTVALAPYAHPSTLSDIVGLMIPGDVGTVSWLAAKAKSAAQSVGRTVDNAGVAIQEGEGPVKFAMKEGGKGVQAVSRLLTGEPDAEGMVNAVEKGSQGYTLQPAQANFIKSISEQIKAGKSLSGAQKQYLNVIYRSMPK